MDISLFSSLLYRVTKLDIIATLILFFSIVKLVQKRRASRVQVPSLKGVPHDNWFLGSFHKIRASENPGLLVDQWAREYGKVFTLPMPVGGRAIVICDMKAIVLLLSKDTFSYHRTQISKVFAKNLLGGGILTVEDEEHRKQRKVMSPAFTSVALRNHLPSFYDSAYKIVAAWENSLSNGQSFIEVQSWINRTALDNLGKGGFGHDFESLDGKETEVQRAFKLWERPETASKFSRLSFLLGPIFPFLSNLPTKHTTILRSMKRALTDIACKVKEESSREHDGFSTEKDRSIIGLLIKSEKALSGSILSQEEVLCQMNTLLLAGYETSSTTLTWAMVELCKHPEAQEKLRDELRSTLQGKDATWEQLSSGLPYLEGFVQETLRLHPAATELTRTVHEDSIVPLGTPVTTATGETISELFIPKGASLIIPIAQIHASEELWGPDAQEFKPERWIDDKLNPNAKQIQGYHHLMTFGDGPRICLGRNFALATIKSTLSVLVRNFKLELPDGPDTQVAKYRGSIAIRAKLADRDGPEVVLKVTKIEN